ncbi:MAG: helix-turn-helix domain-containing protein [bacterium]
MDKSPVRLTVSEAAKLFGVTGKTVRDAIKNGDIKYLVVQGRYKISFPSLVEWSQKSMRRKNKLETEGIGQYIGHWKMTNKKYSPNPALLSDTQDNNTAS